MNLVDPLPPKMVMALLNRFQSKNYFKKSISLSNIIYFINLREIAKNINCYCLFATHFHNLGKNLPNIRHIHMKSSFNNGDLVIHYKAIIDDDLEDSQSFGIEVMKSIKMPEYLIKVFKSIHI